MQKISAPVVFDGCEPHPNGVLVLNDEGMVLDLLPAANADDDSVWRLPHGWLCPGFVNAHCHLELSHLKDRLPAGEGMVPFLKGVMYNRQADTELVQYAMQAAAEEMLGKGIVAVGDICNTALSGPIKAQSPLYWHSFVEVTGFVPATAKQRFDQAVATAAALQQYQPASRISLVPHAPYSVSARLFQLLQHQPQTVVCMHSQESEAEEAFVTRKEGPLVQLYEALGIDISFFEPVGASSLRYCAHLLPKAKSTILVHNCTTTEADLRFLHKSYELIGGQYSFCLCPGANRYIGNPLPNVHMLLQHHAAICLGTDSLASNTELSILHEMQLLQQHYPDLPAAQLLKWATSGGAHALSIAQQFGSFGKGMRPGVLWLEHVTAEGQLHHASVQRLY
jgi:cytosine/adenosine deaminase-related metal-dependent hydrolase